MSERRVSKAPIRDVVQVPELDGERGGKMLVLILECGCFLTRRTKTPPRTAPCVACFVKEKING